MIMFRYFVIGVMLLFVVGCGAIQPLAEQPIDTENDQTNVDGSQTDQTSTDVVTAYHFNFPRTGWYMDFNYEEGFYVSDQGNTINFVVGKDTIMFRWEAKSSVDLSNLEGKDFVGRGWWGDRYTLSKDREYIQFVTPDNKYTVGVSGSGKVFEKFVQGMVMGK